MTFYDSPNDHPPLGLTVHFYWRVLLKNYNSGNDTTYITIELGYENDVMQETRTISGDHTSGTETAVINNLSEYAASLGPIHGAGFLKK